MLAETIRLSLRTISRNALRSFLTVLGIVIGVAAVIVMVTLGQGTTAQVTSDVAYVRFHGRNAVNWYGGTTHGRVDRGSGGGHTDRYDWDYTLAELEEWSGRIREMAARARKAYVFFNNCYMGRAVRSARLMKGLLQPGA